MHQIPRYPYSVRHQNVYICSFRERVLEQCVTGLLILAVPFLALADVLLTGDTTPEFGLIETFQASVLMIMCVLFAMMVLRDEESRPVSIWMLGLFLMMEVREHDWYFDSLGEHLWKVLVLGIFLTCFAFWYPLRSGTSETLRRFLNLKESDLYFLGALIVVVFSRLLGTGSLMGHLVREDVVWNVKTLVQESLEALGYCMLLSGTLRTYKRSFGSPLRGVHTGWIPRR